jgi:hypothetical protein
MDITTLANELASTLKEIRTVEDQRSELTRDHDEALGELRGIEAQQRTALLEAMKEAGEKSTKDEAKTILVKASTKTTHEITDQDVLTAAIIDRGALAEVSRLDLTAAKKYAAEHELPGIEEVAKTTLSVTVLETEENGTN